MSVEEYREAKKRVVRALLERGVRSVEMAEMFGMARQTMSQYIRRHDLDAGLGKAQKERDEYYIIRKRRAVTADPADVEALKVAAERAGMKLEDFLDE